jgi:hypothetical protein
VYVKVVNNPLSAGQVLVLKLDEKFAGEWTQGGSCFSTWLYTNDIMELCWYDDHFNGSYTIECPMFPGCNHIDVHLQFFNFFAYREILGLQPLRKVVFSYDICMADKKEMHTCSGSQTEWLSKDIFNVIPSNISGVQKLWRMGF